MDPPSLMGLVARADENGIPDITDPWPTKDVSVSPAKPVVCKQTDAGRLFTFPSLPLSC